MIKHLDHSSDDSHLRVARQQFVTAGRADGCICSADHPQSPDHNRLTKPTEAGEGTSPSRYAAQQEHVGDWSSARPQLRGNKKSLGLFESLFQIRCADVLGDAVYFGDYFDDRGEFSRNVVLVREG